MSIRLMTAVWELDLSATEKLVMLALADWANDDGHCWPSMKQLSGKTGMTDRGIRKVMGELVAAGHLERDERPGKGVVYTVTPKKNTSETPEPRSAPPRNHVPPEPRSPRNETTETPEPRSANTSVTINTSQKTSSSSRGTRAKPRNKITIPDWVPADAWAGFVEMRKRIRKPLTPRATELIISKLQALAEDGHPPGDVLDQSTTLSWQGIFPLKDQANGNTTAGNQRNGSTERRQLGGMAAAVASLRAERLART